MFTIEDNIHDPNRESTTQKIGRQLREARLEAGVDFEKINEDIHLSREIILALEAGDFEKIGAAVFVRGHLRNYARLLKLPEEDVLSGYQDKKSGPESLNIQSGQHQYRPGFSIVNAVLLAALVLLLLLAIIYWFSGTRV
ncbi:MAG: helix-turn-helix domain-containing protein [Pseudomonadota bacterium]|nr:helix-turn-helix domain-containing protein [Pseudomonadota bacterium]